MRSPVQRSALSPDEPRGQKRVFIDADLMTAVEPAPDRRHDGRRVMAPGGEDALRLLAEGHEVVVIGDDVLQELAEFPGVSTAVNLPEGFPAGSWYVTNDEAWCEGDRPTGLRTILVGPRRPPAKRPTLRCDLEARDLGTAVMEILVRETMA